MLILREFLHLKYAHKILSSRVYLNPRKITTEKIWIDQCPIEVKPVLYKRYVDDSFLLFAHESHVQKFYQYINSKHSRIKFTVENEKDNT